MTFLNWKTLYNLSLPGNNLRHANDTTLMAESKEELKSLLMRVKEKSEKADLKLHIQKSKIMASSPITLWQIQKKKVETVIDFLFLGSNITAVSDCSHEIIRCMLLGRKAAGSQCEEPRPWQRSWRKGPDKTQRWDQASRTPLDFLEHLHPKPEPACFTVLCFKLILLTLQGGYPPPPFSGKS